MFSRNTGSEGGETATDGAAPVMELAKPKSHKTHKPASGTGIPSIIAANLTIRGNLSSEGAVQIDGTVEGDIDSKSLIVGEGASVHGTISADTVMVCGKTEGAIKGKSVQLMSKAWVTGDIVHESLSVEAGASIEGRVGRREAKPLIQPHPNPPAKAQAAPKAEPLPKADPAPKAAAAPMAETPAKAEAPAAEAPKAEAMKAEAPKPAPAKKATAAPEAPQPPVKSAKSEDASDEDEKAGNGKAPD